MPRGPSQRRDILKGSQQVPKAELVLDREAATELVRLLICVVGRTEIGALIDSP